MKDFVLLISLTCIVVVKNYEEYNIENKETNIIKVHLITKLEITQNEYKFITSFFNLSYKHRTSSYYDANLSLLFRQLVIRNCKGRIKWEKLNLKLTDDIMPVNSYLKLLHYISDHLPDIEDDEAQKVLLVYAKMISDYYARKFIALGASHSDYNHIGKLCETWSWITENIIEIIRNQMYENPFYRSFGRFDRFESKFRMFTPKCFPTNSMVESYKSNFRKHQIIDANGCYSIINKAIQSTRNDSALGLVASNESEILNYASNGTRVSECTISGETISLDFSWNLLISGYNTKFNLTQYKLKNCHTGEYLYAAKILDNRYITFGSKTDIQVNETVTAISNVWTLKPLDDGKNYAIMNLNISHNNSIPILSRNQIESKVKLSKIESISDRIDNYGYNSMVWKLEKYSKETFPIENICYELSWIWKKEENDESRFRGESTLSITSIKIETDSKNKYNGYKINVSTSRSSTWRLIRIDSTKYPHNYKYRIQNCQSNEYLVWGENKSYYGNRMYTFTVSEEDLRKDEDRKEINSLWALSPSDSNGMFTIYEARTYLFYLIIQDKNKVHFSYTETSIVLLVGRINQYSIDNFNQWRFERKCD